MKFDIFEYGIKGDPLKPVRRLASLGLCVLAVAVCFYQRGNQTVLAKPFVITAKGQLASHYRQKVELTGVLRVSQEANYLVCGNIQIRLPNDPPPPLSLWDSKVTAIGMLEYEPRRILHESPPEESTTSTAETQDSQEGEDADGYIEPAPRGVQTHVPPDAVVAEDTDGITEAATSGVQTNVPLDVADADRETDVQPSKWGTQTNIPLDAETPTLGDVYWLMDCSITAPPAGR